MPSYFWNKVAHFDFLVSILSTFLFILRNFCEQRVIVKSLPEQLFCKSEVNFVKFFPEKLFALFEIKDSYPTIMKDLLTKFSKFTKEEFQVSGDGREVIFQARDYVDETRWFV